MATPNYDIDYNDERFTELETDKNAALNELNETYDGMIEDSDSYYDAQIGASKEWADTQSQLQQERTDFAIEEINQQKAQTEADYIKEQSGAYKDWQKQSAQHGVNAEQMAASGMQGTGYSESSRVSMYNTYQNRVATARESYRRAVLNYDNAITEARLQNNSALAEIAYNALQQQLELSLQGFQYKNQLLHAKAEAKTALDNTYHQRYQDVLAQINTENALAEEVRQYNESLAEEKRQYDTSFAENQRQYNATLAWEKGQAAKNSSSSGSIKESSSSKSAAEKAEDKIMNSNGLITGRVSESAATTDLTIDVESVKALGRGAISAKELNELVEKGDVEEYVEDGKIKFRNTVAGTAYLNATRRLNGGK